MKLPFALDREVAILEAYLGTIGVGHVYQARLENLPGFLGELMVAGEADPGLLGLPISFTMGKGPLEDESKVRAIRARADELWKEYRILRERVPDQAAPLRGRYLKGIDARLDSPPAVTVKVLRRVSGSSDDLQEWGLQFAREDAALRRLNHRSILRRYGCVTDSRLGPCLVVERSEGKSLERIWRHRMERGKGPLPLAAVAHIAYQLGRALAHAHVEGVVHGDLRPANIHIEEASQDTKSKGIVKVSGFGVEGTAGPMAYAAPEQVRDGVSTMRTDVYQFGVTLYVLATGQMPFELEDPETVRARLLSPDPHANRVHHFRPEIAARFEAMIEGAREKDPEKRLTTDRVLQAVTELYSSKSFSLDGGPRATLAEELLGRARTNAALKDFYRAVEALDLAGDFIKGVPLDRGGDVLQRYDELARELEPARAAVEAIRSVHRKHIAPVDRVMEELYRRYGRGEALLTDDEKGVIEEVGSETVVKKRSLLDWILQHTAEAIKELASVDPELVGPMHRKMADRASSQEVAASDLAARMVKFGEDFRQGG